MQLLVLFTPEVGGWRVRVFPLPQPGEVDGLNDEGECVVVTPPSFDELDRLMLTARAGYRKRRHPSGVTEVTADTPAGIEALRAWVQWLVRGTDCG